MHYLKLFLITLLFSLPAHKLFATHYYGIDLFYTHLSGNTYRVSIVSFGDCSGVQFPSFSATRPRIYIIDDTTTIFHEYLEQELPKEGIEVTEGCPADLKKSTCIDPAGTVPGVKKFIYSKDFTLPYKSANWKFVYHGQTDGTVIAGRSSSLTNVFPVGVISIEATLDNTKYDNSSPQFNSVATQFYCTNEPIQYDIDAVDADGDKLVYELIPGVYGTTPVTYVAGYSGSAPLAAAAGSFSFDKNTGLLNFIPNMLQKSLVVYRVSEYRNGALIGTAMREMTIVVLPCTKFPPEGYISNPSGAVKVNDLTVKACGGNRRIVFDIDPTDTQGDTINMVAKDLPDGARLEIANNNTKQPAGSFVWDMPDLPQGDYNFRVTYTDNACPPAKYTQQYTIRIAPDDIYAEVESATCSTRGILKLTSPSYWSPWTFELYKEGASYSRKEGLISAVWRDSIAPGKYTVKAINHLGCKAETTADVPSSCQIVDVPTAFSPNGDGRNDILYVRGQNVQEMHLRIFNRWGQLVFESHDMAIGWDGKYKGQEAPVESYAYVLSALFDNGGIFQKQGNITMLR